MAEIVTLTPSEGPQGTVLWRMCHKNACGGTADGTAYPDVVVPKGAKNSLMVFSIEGQNDIVFRKAADPYDATEAFYVEPKKSPPTNPGKGIKSDGEFSNVTLANGKTLIFNNGNKTQKDFTYKLHFQHAGGGSATSIDPDIKNSGGGGVGTVSMFSEASATVVIGMAVLIALVAGAVAGLVVKRLG